MNNKIVNYLIKENIIQTNEAEVYRYGIFVISFNVLSIVSIILVGTLFKNTQFSLFFLLFFIPIRILLGGYHCKTPLHCFILFNMLYITILLFKNCFFIPIVIILSLFLFSISVIDYIKQKNSIFYVRILICLLIIYTFIEIFKPYYCIYISSAFFVGSSLYLVNKCVPQKITD